MVRDQASNLRQVTGVSKIFIAFIGMRDKAVQVECAFDTDFGIKQYHVWIPKSHISRMDGSFIVITNWIKKEIEEKIKKKNLLAKAMMIVN